MSQQKQLKRCYICSQFISPNSESQLCKRCTKQDTIPSKEDVDFKTEFVYESVTPDELRQLLGGIKMDFGGKTKYKVFIKRVEDQ